MRICLIKPNKEAYSETFIERHIEFLRCDHDVDVLYGSPLSCHSETDGPLLPEMTLLERAKRSFFRRVLKVDHEYFLESALRRRARKKRYDVVLAEYGPTGVGIVLLCRSLGLPLVVHFHGYDAYQLSHLQEYTEAYKSMFEYAKAIIVVSGDMQQQLARLGCDPQKVYLKPYGVEVSDDPLPQRSSKSKVVLAVGRFVDKKAPHLTLLAFAQVLQACPDASLIMIGDGPLLGACKTLAQSLRITERVEFRGALPHSEIRKAMLEAAVFAQHSVVAADGDSEGTPVAVLEASASGIPVVATSHAGIKEAVVNGETGFLVAEGDIEGMAQRIVDLLQNEELRQRMGMAGKSHVERCYSLDLEKRKLIDILRNAAGG